MPSNKLIVILGPTASGKSTWAEKLARHFNGEIVSADSRQIYRGMDIGTAKVNVGTRRGACLRPKIQTHLLDIAQPNQQFSVAQYKKLAVKIIKDIQKRGKIPFLVGGTGLYVRVVVENLKIPTVKANLQLRQNLEKKTNQELLAQLKKIDPEMAHKIDAKNKRRLIRALEVCLITGQPFSQLRQKGQPLFDVLQIGIKVPRIELYRRIDKRVEQMIKAGLVNEVKHLVKRYLKDDNQTQRPANHLKNNRLSPVAPCSAPIPHPETSSGQALHLPLPKTKSFVGTGRDLSLLPALSGIGYQEIIQYLAGGITLDKAKELIKQHTRQYSRRQMTWFRRDPRIHWVAQYQKALVLLENFLK